MYRLNYANNIGIGDPHSQKYIKIIFLNIFFLETNAFLPLNKRNHVDFFWQKKTNYCCEGSGFTKKFPVLSGQVALVMYDRQAQNGIKGTTILIFSEL